MLDDLQTIYGSKVVPVQYPVTTGPDFNSIIDVILMKKLTWGPDGGDYTMEDIPADEYDKAEEMHKALVEAASENDENLMEKFKHTDYTTAKGVLVFPDHYVSVAHTFKKDDAAAVTQDGRKIVKAGCKLKYQGEFFHEFVTEVECPNCRKKILDALDAADILGGAEVDGGILWCVTELVSKAQLDKAVSIVKEVLK